MPTLLEHLQSQCESQWQQYTQHAFVRQLADGTLPRHCFEHYLKQDYLFLIHFARAFGLAAFKSRNLTELKRANASLSGIVDIELDLHIQYCHQWGISQQQLEDTIESTPNMAYTRYVMERGMAGELLDLNIALAPCILGYGQIANWLLAQPFLVLENNPYAEWINLYAGDEYQQVADAHRQACNATELASLDKARLKTLVQTFDAATRLETDFWQMGLDCS